MLGFGIGFGFSFIQAGSLSTCLWHGCVGAYVTALLARWWGHSWRKNLQEAIDHAEDEPSQALPKLTTSKISKS